MSAPVCECETRGNQYGKTWDGTHKPMCSLWRRPAMSRPRVAIQEETNAAVRLALLDIERTLTPLLVLQAEEMRVGGPVRHVMPPLWGITAEMGRLRLMLVGYCADGNEMLAAAADLDTENAKPEVP